MRNIALLEWGPASLFAVKPRERIKVRTKWLDGGPVLPPFLSTVEEAKAALVTETKIRYALSAFEDLNSAIRNLRRCFGFPYQEYIGYLNTLNQTHRARREHEVLIERLRRWAMFCNVDAVLWVDYAKANQPGAVKSGGRRTYHPFRLSHLEICTEAVGPEHPNGDGDETEAAWSDLEEDHGGQHPTGGPALWQGSHGASISGIPPQDLYFSMGHRNSSLGLEPRAARKQGTLRPFIRLSRLGSPKEARAGSTRAATTSKKSTFGFGPTSPVAVVGMMSARSADETVTKRALASMVEPEEPMTARYSTRLSSLPLTVNLSQNVATHKKESSERMLIREMLQEEVLPVHGSIYARSIVPGPGYYGAPTAPSHQDGVRSFSRRPPSIFENAINFSKELPGPGWYEVKLRHSNIFGRFGKAPRSSPDTPRDQPKLPEVASSDGPARSLSPTERHSVSPRAVESGAAYAQGPRYSFAKGRRPF